VEKRSAILSYTVEGRSVELFCLMRRWEKRSVTLPYTVEGRNVVLFCLIL
jgi:hypothetical protein